MTESYLLCSVGGRLWLLAVHNPILTRADARRRWEWDFNKE